MVKLEIDNNDKFFPSADEWMWNYCVFLGKYVDNRGEVYDLGILLKAESNMLTNEYSVAIVYGDTPGNYISGFIHNEKNETRGIYTETLRRARLLNLIK